MRLYLCMWLPGLKVKGQKNINGQSNVSLCSSRPIRFLEAGSSANQDFRQSNERSALYNSGKAAVLLSSALSMGCTMSLLAYNLTMGVTQR